MNFDPANPKPGRYTDLPIETYHQGPGVSRSTLKVLEEGTPLDCWHYQQNGIKETDAMKLGSAVDMLVFEPERCPTELVVRPKFGRKKEDLLAKAEFEDRTAGRLVITEAQWEHATAIVEAVRGSKAVRGLMSNAGAQESFYWIEEDILVKARPDGYDAEKGWTFDLKTVAAAGGVDLSDRTLTRRMVDGAYEAQAAMCAAGCIANGLPWKGHVIVWASKSEPYDVRCQLIEPGDSWHVYGEARYQRWLRTYAKCQKAGEWPGYSGTIARIEAPSWVEAKSDAELHLAREAHAEGIQ